MRRDLDRVGVLGRLAPERAGSVLDPEAVQPPTMLMVRVEHVHRACAELGINPPMGFEMDSISARIDEVIWQGGAGSRSKLVPRAVFALLLVLILVWLMIG